MSGASPGPCATAWSPPPKPSVSGPTTAASPDPEAKALGEHYGWRYLAAWGQFFIYASDQPGARELNTDPVVQSMALDLVCKRQRRDFILSLFWPILYLLLFFRGSVLELLLEMGAWRFLWAAILVLWGTWASFSSLHSLGRLRKKLARRSAPEPPEKLEAPCQGPPAQRLAFHGPHRRLVLRLSEPLESRRYGDQRPLPVRGLRPLPLRHPGRPGGGRDLLSGGRLPEQPLGAPLRLLAPEIIDYRENGGGTTPDGQPFSGGLDVKYYRLASAGLARELYRELLSKAPRERHYAPLSLPSLDADQQAAYTGYFPTLLLQKGDKVIQITFYQLADPAIPLEDWATAFASGF